jgi:hypothetical protein
MPEPEDTILTNALAPKSASGDSGAMSQHSIDDQIKAATFQAGVKRAKARKLPVRFVKMIPPGGND